MRLRRSGESVIELSFFLFIASDTCAVAFSACSLVSQVHELQTSLAEKSAESQSLQEDLRRLGNSERQSLRRHSLEASDHLERMSEQLCKQRKEAATLRRSMERLKTKAAEKGIFLNETVEEAGEGRAASSAGRSVSEQNELSEGHDDDATGSP